MRLQVEQLQKEKRECEAQFRVISKRIDHMERTERTYRQEERPLLVKDYELQQAIDRATFKRVQKGPHRRRATRPQPQSGDEETSRAYTH